MLRVARVLLCLALTIGSAPAHGASVAPRSPSGLISIDGSFTGSWFDPDRSGEGWVLQVLDDGQAFVAWFTYPPADKGMARQAWLVGSGAVDGDSVVFDSLLQISGPVFGPGFDPDARVISDWGALEMQFFDCDDASLAYAGPVAYGQALRNVVRLTGIVDRPCGNPPAGKREDGLRPLSGAWFDPSHDGEGWFFEELADGRVNLYWFTYDDQGNAAWLTGVGMRQGDRVEFAELFLVTGPLFGDSFDPQAVTLESWGTVRFDLLQCGTAELSYQSPLPGFGAGALAPVRLTRIEGVACEDPPSVPLTNGTWREIAPPPTQRSEASGAVLGGIAYFSGGFGGPQALESYDLRSDSWSMHPDMPDGKNHHMAVAHEGKIYVFGGFRNGTFASSPSAFRYDPETRLWEQIPNVPQDSAAANVGLSHGGFIYLLGGIGPRGLRFDPVTGSYRQLPPPAHLDRDHSTSVVFGNELWLLGGRGNSEINSVEIFDPATETWRAAAAMTENRSGFGAAVVQGQIMAAGGELLSGGFSSWRTLKSFEVFVPGRNEFVRGPDMPLALHGIVALSVDGRLLILGGGAEPGSAAPARRNFLYEPAPAP